MKAVQSLYAGSETCVRVGRMLSDWFPISQGVRQCCMLLPWLLDVFMDRSEVKVKLQDVQLLHWFRCCYLQMT